MSNENFDFNRFVSESKQTLLNPKGYFTGISLTGGMAEPVIKAVIYGAAAGILWFLWSMLRIGAVAIPFGGAVSIFVLVWAVVGALAGLFIGAVIILVISSIAKGNSEFEACLRISASILVLLPVSALLTILGTVGLRFSMIVGLLINLYGLWLIYNAVVISLKADIKTTRIIVIVLGAILVISTLAGMGTRRATSRYFNRMGRDIDRETREMMKDFGIR